MAETFKNSKSSAAGESPLVGYSWGAFQDHQPSHVSLLRWSAWQPPPELCAVDDDRSVPDKLKDILQWSLTPGTFSKLNSTSQGARQPISGGVGPQSPVRRELDDILFQASQYNFPDNFPVGQLADNVRYASNTGDNLLSQSSQQSPTNGGQIHKLWIGKKDFLSSTIDQIAAKAKGRQQSNPSIPTPTVECISCFEDFAIKDTATLSCTHSYCKPCLSTLITTSMQNEASFPPKCCITQLPLETILIHLTSKGRELYKSKAAEFAIPAEERWYCPNTKCLKWIPPGKLSRSWQAHIRCPHCSTRICSTCRGREHRGSLECPEDFSLQATMEAAELAGWRRCYKCKSMVERTEGCRHMTCRCSAQFCYTCGVKWRTCTCTEIDEITRQTELRHRRDMRYLEIDQEEREIARAIAAIEELERHEAEQRRLEEEAAEVERLRQEAELFRLEKVRLQGEAARRQRQDQADRELRAALRISLLYTCQSMKDSVRAIERLHQKALDDRQLVEERRCRDHCRAAVAQHRDEIHALVTKMEHSISKRKQTVSGKHRTEFENFTAEQEDLEDDMFMQIQVHLHGKPNKDVREERLKTQLRQHREEERLSLAVKQKSEIEVLGRNATMELMALKKRGEDKEISIQHFYAELHAKLASKAWCERKWFEILTERRRNMVTANNKLVQDAYDAGEEPTGLTEEIAKTIGPFIPNVGSEESMQGLSPMDDAVAISLESYPATESKRRDSVERTYQSMGRGSPTDSVEPTSSSSPVAARPPNVSAPVIREPLTPQHRRTLRSGELEPLETHLEDGNTRPRASGSAQITPTSRDSLTAASEDENQKTLVLSLIKKEVENQRFINSPVSLIDSERPGFYRRSTSTTISSAELAPSGPSPSIPTRRSQSRQSSVESASKISDSSWMGNSSRSASTPSSATSLESSIFSSSKGPKHTLVGRIPLKTPNEVKQHRRKSSLFRKLKGSERENLSGEEVP